MDLSPLPRHCANTRPMQDNEKYQPHRHRENTQLPLSAPHARQDLVAPLFHRTHHFAVVPAHPRRVVAPLTAPPFAHSSQRSPPSGWFCPYPRTARAQTYQRAWALGRHVLHQYRLLEPQHASVFRMDEDRRHNVVSHTVRDYPHFSENRILASRQAHDCSKLIAHLLWPVADRP